MYIHIFSKIISNVSFDRSTFSGLCCAPNQTQLTVFRERSSAGQAAAASKVEIYNANTLAAVWVSQDKPQPGPALHTWSPLASLFGPHYSLMTVAILIRDTWSRGEVAAELHSTAVFMIWSQWWAGHYPQQFACDVAMPGARAVKVVTTAVLGLGPCLAGVLYHIDSDNNQHCQLWSCCLHPHCWVHDMGSWVICCEEVWSSRRSCDVWQRDKCRQYLRRKMWRFRSYQ